MQRFMLLLLALLLGSASAGPYVSRSQNRNNLCSMGCPRDVDLARLHFTPGETHTFHYSGETVTTIRGATEEHSGLVLTAKVHVDALSNCHMVMRVTDTSTNEIDPTNRNLKTSSPRDADIKAALERHALHFKLIDGHVVQLCAETDDAEWVLNVKRGIISSLQHTMKNLGQAENTTETDVSGKCPVHYSIAGPAWGGQSIRKVKQLLGCTGRENHVTSLQSSPYRVPSQIQSMPFTQGEHSCIHTFRRGRFAKVVCTETHLFRPFSHRGNGAVTEVTQKLETIGYKKTETVVDSSKLRVSSLLFQHEKQVQSLPQAKDQVIETMAEICRRAKTEVRPDTPRLFAELVYRLRRLSEQDLVEINALVRAGRICLENNFEARPFFYDAVAFMGTPTAATVMTQMILANQMSTRDADAWLTSLAFLQSPPTSRMLQQLAPLLEVEQPRRQALLGVSSLVHQFCKVQTNCQSDPNVARIVKVILGLLKSDCRATNPEERSTMLVVLKAVGNMGGQDESIGRTLSQCAQKVDNPMAIRVAAVQAFRRLSCDMERSPLMTIFKDSEIDSELRIEAYISIMTCPSSETIFHVRAVLEKEKVNQVGSFVWTHLTNLRETADPHKQEIRQILEDSTLKKEFNMDKLKFSRNVEKSLFFKSLNTGAKMESNLIWSQTSFLPRSASLNLTLDLFGKSFNFLEVDGRVEGLDLLLEKLVGPEGYYKKMMKGGKQAPSQKLYIEALKKIEGSLGFKVFGNEISFFDFIGKNAEDGMSINFLDILLNLAKDHEYDFTKSFMFMDTTVSVPTIMGLPLKLSMNGSATIDLKMRGKLDVRKLMAWPTSFDIKTYLKPSAALDLSAHMGVDAFYSRYGVKVVSSVHTSTEMEAIFTAKDSEKFDVEVKLPKEKQEIVNFNSQIYVVHRDAERKQNLPDSVKTNHKLCLTRSISNFLGFELCGAMTYPSRKARENSPLYPLSGEASGSIILKRLASHTGYKMSGLLKQVKHRDQAFYSRFFQLLMDTPGSKPSRRFLIDLTMDAPNRILRAQVVTPWKSFHAEANCKSGLEDGKALVMVQVDKRDLFKINGNWVNSYKGDVMTRKSEFTVNFPLLAKTPFGMSAKVVISPTETSGEINSEYPVLIKAKGSAKKIDLKNKMSLTKIYVVKGEYETFLGSGELLSTFEKSRFEEKLDFSIKHMKSKDAKPLMLAIRHKLQDISSEAIQKGNIAFSISIKEDIESFISLVADGETSNRHAKTAYTLKYGNGESKEEISGDLYGGVVFNGPKATTEGSLTFRYPAKGINYMGKMNTAAGPNLVMGDFKVSDEKNQLLELIFSHIYQSRTALHVITKAEMTVTGRKMLITSVIKETSPQTYEFKIKNIVNGKEAEISGTYLYEDKLAHHLSATISAMDMNLPFNLKFNLMDPSKSFISYSMGVADEPERYSIDVVYGLRPHAMFDPKADGSLFEYEIVMKCKQYQWKSDAKLILHKEHLLVSWTGQRHPTKKVAVLFEIYKPYPENSKYDRKLRFRLSYPGKWIELSLNSVFELLKMQSQLDFAWSKKDKVSLHTMYDINDGWTEKGLTGSVTLKTPFENWQTTHLGINALGQLRYRKVDIDCKWGNKKFANLAVIVQPKSTNDFISSVKLRTSIPRYSYVGIQVKHLLTDRQIATQAALDIGSRVKFAFDIEAYNNGDSQRNDITGTIKVDAWKMKDIAITFKHKDDGAVFDSEFKATWAPEKAISASSTFRYARDGLQVRTKGNLNVEAPFEAHRSAKLEWVHDNTDERLTTSMTALYNDKEVFGVEGSGKYIFNNPHFELDLRNTIRIVNYEPLITKLSYFLAKGILRTELTMEAAQEIYRALLSISADRKINAELIIDFPNTPAQGILGKLDAEYRKHFLDAESSLLYGPSKETLYDIKLKYVVDIPKTFDDEIPNRRPLSTEIYLDLKTAHPKLRRLEFHSKQWVQNGGRKYTKTTRVTYNEEQTIRIEEEMDILEDGFMTEYSIRTPFKKLKNFMYSVEHHGTRGAFHNVHKAVYNDDYSFNGDLTFNSEEVKGEWNLVTKPSGSKSFKFDLGKTANGLGAKTLIDVEIRGHNILALNGEVLWKEGIQLELAAKTSMKRNVELKYTLQYDLRPPTKILFATGGSVSIDDARYESKITFDMSKSWRSVLSAFSLDMNSQKSGFEFAYSYLPEEGRYKGTIELRNAARNIQFGGSLRRVGPYKFTFQFATPFSVLKLLKIDFDYDGSPKMFKHSHSVIVKSNDNTFETKNSLDVVALRYIKVTSFVKFTDNVLYDFSYQHQVKHNKFESSLSFLQGPIKINAGFNMEFGRHSTIVLDLKTSFKEFKNFLVKIDQRRGGLHGWMSFKHVSKLSCEILGTTTSIDNQLEWSDLAYVTASSKIAIPGIAPVSLKFLHQLELGKQHNLILKYVRGDIEYSFVSVTSGRSLVMTMKSPHSNWRHIKVVINHVTRGSHVLATIKLHRSKETLIDFNYQFAPMAENPHMNEHQYNLTTAFEPVKNIKVKWTVSRPIYGVLGAKTTLHVTADRLSQPIMLSARYDARRLTNINVDFQLNAPRIESVSATFKTSPEAKGNLITFAAKVSVPKLFAKDYELSGSYKNTENEKEFYLLLLTPHEEMNRSELRFTSSLSPGHKQWDFRLAVARIEPVTISFVLATDLIQLKTRMPLIEDVFLEIIPKMNNPMRAPILMNNNITVTLNIGQVMTRPWKVSVTFVRRPNSMDTSLLAETDRKSFSSLKTDLSLTFGNIRGIKGEASAVVPGLSEPIKATFRVYNNPCDCLITLSGPMTTKLNFTMKKTGQSRLNVDLTVQSDLLTAPIQFGMVSEYMKSFSLTLNSPYAYANGIKVFGEAEIRGSQLEGFLKVKLPMLPEQIKVEAKLSPDMSKFVYTTPFRPLESGDFTLQKLSPNTYQAKMTSSAFEKPITVTQKLDNGVYDLTIESPFTIVKKMHFNAAWKMTMNPYGLITLSHNLLEDKVVGSFSLDGMKKFTFSLQSPFKQFAKSLNINLAADNESGKKGLTGKLKVNDKEVTFSTMVNFASTDDFGATFKIEIPTTDPWTLSANIQHKLVGDQYKNSFTVSSSRFEDIKYEGIYRFTRVKEIDTKVKLPWLTEKKIQVIFNPTNKLDATVDLASGQTYSLTTKWTFLPQKKVVSIKITTPQEALRVTDLTVDVDGDLGGFVSTVKLMNTKLGEIGGSLSFKYPEPRKYDFALSLTTPFKNFEKHSLTIKRLHPSLNAVLSSTLLQNDIELNYENVESKELVLTSLILKTPFTFIRRTSIGWSLPKPIWGKELNLRLDSEEMGNWHLTSILTLKRRLLDWSIQIKTPIEALYKTDLVVKYAMNAQTLKAYAKIDNSFLGAYEVSKDVSFANGILTGNVKVNVPSLDKLTDLTTFKIITSQEGSVFDISLICPRRGKFGLTGNVGWKGVHINLKTPYPAYADMSISAKETSTAYAMTAQRNSDNKVTLSIYPRKGSISLDFTSTIENYKSVTMKFSYPVNNWRYGGTQAKLTVEDKQVGLSCVHSLRNGASIACSWSNSLIPALRKSWSVAAEVDAVLGRSGKLLTKLDIDTTIYLFKSEWQPKRILAVVKTPFAGFTDNLLDIKVDCQPTKGLHKINTEIRFGSFEITKMVELVLQNPGKLVVSLKKGSDIFEGKTTWAWTSNTQLESTLEIRRNEERLFAAEGEVFTTPMKGFKLKVSTTKDRPILYTHIVGEYEPPLGIVLTGEVKIYDREYKTKVDTFVDKIKSKGDMMFSKTDADGVTKSYEASFDHSLMNYGDRIEIKSCVKILGQEVSIEVSTDQMSEVKMILRTPYNTLNTKGRLFFENKNKLLIVKAEADNEYFGNHGVTLQIAYGKDKSIRVDLITPKWANTVQAKGTFEFSPETLVISGEMTIPRKEPVKFDIRLGRKEELSLVARITTPFELLRNGEMLYRLKFQNFFKLSSNVNITYTGPVKFSYAGNLDTLSAFVIGSSMKINNLVIHEMVFSHIGTLGEFVQRGMVQIGKAKGGYEMSGGFTPLFVGSFSMFTPIRGLKQFKITGEQLNKGNRFFVNYKISMDDNQDIQLRLDQLRDANNFDTSIEFDTPYKSVGFKVAHKRTRRSVDSQASFSWGKKKYVSLHGKFTPKAAGYHGNLILKTPFLFAKHLEMNVLHQRDVDGRFRFDHKFTYAPEKHIQLQGHALIAGMNANGQIVFVSPFPKAENLKLDFEHSTNPEGHFKFDHSIQYAPEQKVNLHGSVIPTRKQFKVRAVLSAPHPMFQHVEVNLDHHVSKPGYLRFDHSITYGHTKPLHLYGYLHRQEGLLKSRVVFNTPHRLFKHVEFTSHHDWKTPGVITFAHNYKYSPEKRVSFSGKLEHGTGYLRCYSNFSAPHPSWKQIQLKLDHFMDKDGLQFEHRLTYAEKKHIGMRGSYRQEGKLKIGGITFINPMKVVTLLAKHNGDFKNFENELSMSLNEEQKIRLMTKLNILKKMAAEVELMTPWKRLQNLAVKLQHEGSRWNYTQEAVIKLNAVQLLKYAAVFNPTSLKHRLDLASPHLRHVELNVDRRAGNGMLTWSTPMKKHFINIELKQSPVRQLTMKTSFEAIRIMVMRGEYDGKNAEVKLQINEDAFVRISGSYDKNRKLEGKLETSYPTLQMAHVFVVKTTPDMLIPTVATKWKSFNKEHEMKLTSIQKNRDNFKVTMETTLPNYPRLGFEAKQIHTSPQVRLTCNQESLTFKSSRTPSGYTLQATSTSRHLKEARLEVSKSLNPLIFKGKYNQFFAEIKASITNEEAMKRVNAVFLSNIPYLEHASINIEHSSRRGNFETGVNGRYGSEIVKANLKATSQKQSRAFEITAETKWHKVQVKGDFSKSETEAKGTWLVKFNTLSASGMLGILNSDKMRRLEAKLETSHPRLNIAEIQVKLIGSKYNFDTRFFGHLNDRIIDLQGMRNPAGIEIRMKAPRCSSFFKLAQTKESGLLFEMETSYKNKQYSGVFRGGRNQGFVLKAVTPFRRFETIDINVSHKQEFIFFTHKSDMKINGQLVHEADLEFKGPLPNLSLNVRRPVPFSASYTQKGPIEDRDISISLDLRPGRKDSKITVGAKWNFLAGKDVTLRLIIPSRELEISMKCVRQVQSFHHEISFNPDRRDGPNGVWSLVLKKTIPPTTEVIVTTPLRKLMGRITNSRTPSTKKAVLQFSWNYTPSQDNMVEVVVDTKYLNQGIEGRLELHCSKMTSPIIACATIKSGSKDNEILANASVQFSDKRDDDIKIKFKFVRPIRQSKECAYHGALSVSQMTSNLDTNFEFHFNWQPAELSHNVIFTYLTASKETKIFSALTEMKLLNPTKVFTVQLVSPYKSVRMITRLAPIQGGFKLSVDNVYDAKRKISGFIEVTDRPLIKMRLHYDPAKPQNFIEANARYVTDGYVKFDIYRTKDKRQIEEFLVSLKVTMSTLVQGRLRWNPNAIMNMKQYWTDLKYRARGGASRMGGAIGEALRTEIELKKIHLRRAIPDYLKVSDYFSVELDLILKDLGRIASQLQIAYNKNEFYVQDIHNELKRVEQGIYTLRRIARDYTDFVADKALDKLRRLGRRLARSHGRMMDKMGEVYAVAKHHYNRVYDQGRAVASHYYGKVVDFTYGHIERAVIMTRPIAHRFVNLVEHHVNRMYEQTLPQLKRRIIRTYTPTAKYLRDLLYEGIHVSKYLHKSFGSYQPKVDLILTPLRYMNETRIKFEHLLDRTIGLDNLNNLGGLLREAVFNARWALSKLYTEEAIKSMARTHYIYALDYLQDHVVDAFTNYIKMGHLRVINYYDGKVERREIEFITPFPMKDLKSLPDFSVLPRTAKSVAQQFQNIVSRTWEGPSQYIVAIKQYGWSLPTMGVSPRGWMPRFETFASIAGSHVITFDKIHYTLQDDRSCSYTLVQDLKNRRWSIMMEGGENKRSLIVVIGGKKIQLNSDYQVTVDSQRVELPYIDGNLKIIRFGRMLKIKDAVLGFSITGDLENDVYTVGVSNWYHGQLGGLFGNMDNEGYNDFRDRNGKMVTPGQFVDSWTIGKCSGRQPNVISEEPTNVAKKGRFFCGFLFKCPLSPLSSCFKKVDPAPFLKMCLQDQTTCTKNCPIKQICKAALAYASQCKKAGAKVRIPYPCRKCNLPKGNVLKIGEKKTLASAVPLADVILVVEENRCLNAIRPQLASLISQLEKALVRRGIQNVRFGLVGYGNPEHGRRPGHSHTIAGQLLGNSKDMEAAIRSLRTPQTTENPFIDALLAVRYAARSPFRPEAAKHIVLLPCTPCKGGSWLASQTATMLQDAGIDLSVVQDLGRTVPEGTRLQSFFGLDSRRFFTAKHQGGRRMPLNLQKTVPARDSCIMTAMKTGGSIFHLPALIGGHVTEQDRFMDSFGRRVAEGSKPSLLTECQCEEDGSTRSALVCKSRMPHALTNVKPLVRPPRAARTFRMNYVKT